MSGQRKRHRSNNVLPLTTTMMMDVISNAASKNTILTTAATSSSSKWKLTPLSILIRMMAYMDNGTLMIMCLVCKQVKDLIWHGTGMENKLVRIFECSPSSETKIQNSSLAAARRFAINMDRYCQDGTKHRILQGYQQLKVYNVGRLHVGSAMMMGTGEARELTQNVRLNGIITLNIIPSSLPRNTIYEHEEAWDLIYVLSCIVPNLRHLNLSTALITTDILENFSVRCPLLETIKWNDNTNYSFVANGNHLRLMNTLRELHLDNYNFWFDQYINEDANITDDNNDDDPNNNFDITELEAMSDMHNHPNIFLFHKLRNQPLEVVSIRNVQHGRGFSDNVMEIPQNVLLKFVRNAPVTLKWFRSNLSTANMQVLQSERPRIEFMN